MHWVQTFFDPMHCNVWRRKNTTINLSLRTLFGQSEGCQPNAAGTKVIEMFAMSPVLMDQLLEGGPSVSEAKDMGSPDKDSKVKGGSQVYVYYVHKIAGHLNEVHVRCMRCPTSSITWWDVNGREEGEEGRRGQSDPDKELIRRPSLLPMGRVRPDGVHWFRWMQVIPRSKNQSQSLPGCPNRHWIAQPGDTPQAYLPHTWEVGTFFVQPCNNFACRAPCAREGSRVLGLRGLLEGELSTWRGPTASGQPEQLRHWSSLSRGGSPPPPTFWLPFLPTFLPTFPTYPPTNLQSR